MRLVWRWMLWTRDISCSMWLACIVITQPLASQTHRYREPATVSSTEAVPETIFLFPISLRDGIGHAHEEITTSSVQAQAYCDQGLSFLYSYDWIAAARSFHEALRLDHNVAMAYLGLSYVYSAFADNDRAREMADKARQLAGHARPAERVRIKLRLAQLTAMESQGAGFMRNSFVRALDDALKTDSNNVNLLLMRGTASEGYAAAIGQRGLQESIHYYQQVLALDPDNAAAHHFLIHSNEMTNNLPEAIKHAEIYQRLAPSVAHAHHMYGHDLRRTQRVREAITEFEKANDIEESDYSAEPQTLLYDWNYRHNLNLLAATYAQAGLSSAAARTFKKLAESRSITAADDLYKAQYTTFLLREKQEKEAIVAAAALRNSQFAVGRLLSHALSGSALARLGNATQAREELLATEKDLTSLSPEWRALVSTRMDILKAQVELLTGQNKQGALRLRSLVLRIRALPGSDAWSDLIFHLQFIAEIVIKAGEWDLARFVAHQLQDNAPFYRGTHTVLAHIAQHDGDAGTAARESETARELTLQ